MSLADKTARSLVDASPRDVFVGKHLYSVDAGDGQDDWLEREWDKIESEHFPEVERFRSGHHDPSSENSVKTIMALHLARSRLLHDFRQIQKQTRISELIDASPSQTALLEAYEAQFGSRPTAETIRAAVVDYSTRVDETNALDVELTVYSFNSAVEYLSQFFLQRVEVEQFSAIRLFLGDSPVVVSQNGRVSAANRPVAIGDADEAFMPLAPTVAAALSVEPIPNKRGFPPAEAKRLNRYTVKAAKRHFIARSAADVRSSLGSRWA